MFFTTYNDLGSFLPGICTSTKALIFKNHVCVMRERQCEIDAAVITHVGVFLRLRDFDSISTWIAVCSKSVNEMDVTIALISEAEAKETLYFSVV